MILLPFLIKLQAVNMHNLMCPGCTVISSATTPHLDSPHPYPFAGNMGVPGLLQALSACMQKVHISSYRGKRVAVDSYVWLHRAVLTCAADLCLNIPTRKYVDYFVALVQALIHDGVIPVLVFDGDKLPAKQEEETRRKTTRMRCLSNASQFMQEGRKKEADRLFAQAVDVTPQLAHAVQCAIYDLGIEILVAPYEADAQLAFLARNGHVDAVISEDSELLVYGCPEVLFKYDSVSGTCDRILERDLASCMNSPSHADADFLKHVAVLTGCDYCPGVSGIGIKKSVDALKTYGGGYVGAVAALRAQGRVFTDDDVLRMKLGFLTFKHQVVYNPVSRCLQHLDSIPAGAAQYDTSFLGRMYENINAIAVANGRADPMTKLPFHAPVAESALYTSLAAAVEGYAGDSTALFSIWAVVTQFSPPRKTKGSDMQVGLTLLDASSPQPVKANLFIKVTPVPPPSHFSLMQCASSCVISGRVQVPPT